MSVTSGQLDIMPFFSDLNELKRLAGSSAKARVELLGSHDPQGECIIPDPYYEAGTRLFEQVGVASLRVF